MESVDLYLQNMFDSATHVTIEALLCLALIIFTVPQALVFVIPVLCVYYRIQRDYRRPAREIKRLDSIHRILVDIVLT